MGSILKWRQSDGHFQNGCINQKEKLSSFGRALWNGRLMKAQNETKEWGQHYRLGMKWDADNIFTSLQKTKVFCILNGMSTQNFRNNEQERMIGDLEAFFISIKPLSKNMYICISYDLWRWVVMGAFQIELASFFKNGLFDLVYSFRMNCRYNVYEL